MISSRTMMKSQLRATLFLLAFVLRTNVARNPRYKILIRQADAEIHISADEQTTNANVCDADKLRHYGRKFMQNLGVSGDGTIGFARRLKALEIVYGRRGFEKICNAQRSFRKYMGSEMFSNCMNVPSIVKNLDESRSNAVNFLATFMKKAYECDHVYDFTAEGTWECLGMTVLDSGKLRLERCYASFRRNISTHQEEICRYANEYGGCVQNVFERYCGAKIARRICELTQISFGYRLPQCSIRCKQSPFEQHFVDRPYLVDPKLSTDQHLSRSLIESKSGNECNRTLLLDCVENARKSVGIGKEFIRNTLNDIKAMSKYGMEQICRQNELLQNCMNGEVLKCTNMDALMDMGLGLEQMTSINLTYYIINYECSNPVILGNGDCIERTNEQSVNAIGECRDQFEKIIQQTPPHEILCKGLQTFAICVKKIFDSSCSARVGSAMCSFLADMAHSYLPKTLSCDTKCHIRHELLNGIVSHQNLTQSSSIATVSNDRKCNKSVFLKCGRGFCLELGIKYKDVYSFVFGIKRIVDRKGKIGFEKICRAADDYAKCSGKLTQSCTDIGTLQRQFHMSPNDAYLLSVTSFSIGYECAHPVFTNNFECLLTVEHRKQKIIEGCARRFAYEIKHHGLPCKACQHLVDCVSSVYRRQCGREAAMGVCRLYKAMLHKYIPHVRGCPLDCDVSETLDIGH